MAQTDVKGSKRIVKEMNGNWYVIALLVIIVFLVLSPFLIKNGGEFVLRAKRMLNKQAHVVIISTYGPSVNGSPFYEAYVDKAVKFVSDPTNKVDEVVIVGGYTVDPSRSQSQAVLDFIDEKYPAFKQKNIPVTLDECGITTWQNIINSKKLMDKEGISPKKITIFAEESREQKVSYFSNALFHWDKNSAEINKEEIFEKLDSLIHSSKDAQLKSYSNFTSIGFGRATFSTNNSTVKIITVPSGLDQHFIDDEHAKIFEEIKEFYDPEYGKKAIKERLDSWAKTVGFNTAQNLFDKGCADYKQFLNK